MIRLRPAPAAIALAATLALGSPSAFGATPDRTKLDQLIQQAEAMDGSANPQAALQTYEAALAEALRIYPPSHPEIAYRQIEIASAKAGAGDFEGAAKLLAEWAPRLAKTGPDALPAQRTALNLSGFINGYRGDHAAAIAAFTKELATYPEHPPTAKEAKLRATALANIGATQWEAGDTASALEYNRRALELGRTVEPIIPDIAVWYASRVAFLRSAGQMDQAIRTGQEAIGFLEPRLPANHAGLANLHANVGALLALQNRPIAAMPLLRRAYEAIEAIQGKPTENSAAMRAMFAKAMIDAGRYEDAVPFIQSVVPIIDKQLGPQSNRALQTREVLARALSRVGRHQEAIATERAVLAVRDEKLAATHSDRMSGRATLARLLADAGQLEEAARVAAEGVAMRAAALPPTHLDYLAERANLLALKTRLPAVRPGEIGREGRELLDLIAASVQRDPTVGINQVQRAGFMWISEALARAGDREGAFLAQQWAARTTVDDAAIAARAERLLSGTQSDLAQVAQARRAALVERTAAARVFENQIATSAPGFDRAAAFKRLADADLALRDADAKLSAAGLADWRFSPLTIAEVRSRLAPGQVLIQATAGVSRYLVTAISERGDAQAVVEGAAAVDLAQRLRASVASDDGDRPFDKAAAADLYRLLFPAEIARITKGARELKVSANGALGAIPFALLVPDKAKDTFLMEKVAIARLASVSSLGRTGSAQPSHQFVGIGDGDNPLAELPRLPAAARELDELAATVGDSQPVTLVSSAATEAALRGANIMPGSVLAFATHGLVSGEIASLREPALLLTPSASDDGLLTSTEISRMTLPAQWVVLSACNTTAGAGPDEPGLSGLAQSFIQAGAGTILATHWRVRDDMAQAITARTLTGVAQGRSASQALRDAMIAARKESAANRDAVGWAAFEVIE